MEFEGNQGGLATSATSEKLATIDSDPKTPTRTPKSLITKYVHQSHDDGFVWNDKLEDFELRKEILTLGDATESKFEEMVNKLLEILDDTTDILGGADEDEDSDNDYQYVLRGHLKGDNVTNLDDDDDDDAFDDAIGTPNIQIDSVSCPEIVTETKEFNTTGTTAAKNQTTRKFNELNEFTESLMIVLMLFSLYFLLSSLVYRY